MVLKYLKSGLLILVLFASCKSIYRSDLYGEYNKVGKDYKYSLYLREDSTFTLTQINLGVSSGCKGRWHRLLKDTIVLNCSEEKLPAILESGYINDRERRLIILSTNKLKMGTTILQR